MKNVGGCIFVNILDHIRLMATYNTWMNEKIYQAAMTLSPEALAADRKAFFGSILGTLNHLVVADTIWLKRFSAHPANYVALAAISDLLQPTSLDQMLFAEIEALAQRRNLLDGVIEAWSREITEVQLDHMLSYANMKGVVAQKNFFSLLMHFFNHQTHHRGQTTTLLVQAGVDCGATDLLLLIPSV